MVRRNESGAEYIERRATEVTLVLGDMVEHLGTATQAGLKRWKRRAAAISMQR